MSLLFIVLIALTTLVGTPVATPAAVWECDRLPEYQDRVNDVFDGLNLTTAEEDQFDAISETDPESLRPSQLRFMSTIFDDIATGLEGIPAKDIPFVARSYHQAMIDMFGTYATVYSAMASIGIFGAIPYVEEMNDISDRFDDAIATGMRACGSQWPDTLDSPLDQS